jgi:hypothetical protein
MWIENTWVFPALEAAHVIGLAMLVGSITLANIGKNPPERIRRIGLWVMVATGLVMFASDYDRYIENPAFWTKMALLVPALWVRTPRWSLVMWTLTVLAARAVIDFDA